MNLNEPVLNPDKGHRLRAFDRFKVPFLGPTTKETPKARSALSSSRTSDLPWGKSHDSLALNSSSNKRSTSSRSTTENEEEKVIVAITEGRGEARCEVGLAAINVTRSALILCQTSDSQSYTNTLTKLNIFNPHSIIYPITFETGKGNRLIAEIRKYFPNKKLITIPRKAFNKSNGLDRLQKICIASSFPLLIMIKNRYYALASASGLLSYLQDSLYIYYANNTIKLEYQASEGYAIIDIATADRLELVSSNQPAQANKYSCLFGIMNRCLTRVGTRNLRSIILQPLFSNQKIKERLDCVEELIKNPEILLSIQGILPKLSGIDQLLSLGTLVPEDPQRCTNRQLNYLLLLNSVIDSIQPLKEAMKNATNPFFVQLRTVLKENDFDVIKESIRETIHEEAYSAKGQQAEQQRIWAIKPGLNGLLDLVRKTYSERIEDMREYIKKLSQKYDLPLTLANNNKKGYHIVLTLNQNQRRHMKSSDLPQEFIQVFRLANSFTMKTAELVNLSTRIDDILTDLFTLSNLMIHHIIVKMKQYMDLFYKLVEGISYLDVLQSLAEASYANSWTRPTFDQYTEVTFGHHPLLDFLCQKRPISNPVTACEHYNVHIITGPNGAGKSIFIRQVMLLQIMAQAGCFVPAQTATFRLADKMFARISNEDDMESNASSFVLEMTEVNYILNTMTDRSLIIIDELCRSTSVEAGTAIAMMICDSLARSGAYTFVTTHFTLLTRLVDSFFNIKVWQLETIPSGDPNNPKSMKLDFKFSLVPGATSLRGYGIYMVRGIWPSEVLEYVDYLQEQYTKKNKDPKFPILDQVTRLKYDSSCKLKKLKLKKKLTITNLNKHVQEFNNEMQRIGLQTDQHCQNIMEHFQEITGEASAIMDHSIFDVSMNNSEPVGEDISQLYLQNLTGNISEAEAAGLETLSPMTNRGDAEDSVTSISEAKKRMQEIFSPDTKLDISDMSTSTYQSTDQFLNLEPELILSYSPSQCSLDLTQEALQHELGQNIQDHSAINEQDKHNSDQKSQFLGQFQGFSADENFVTVSQLSSHELSQKLEAIRNEKECATRVEQAPFKHPAISKWPPKPGAVPESPFVTTFARPLQNDSRKTSTPLITIRAEAKNVDTPSVPTPPLSKRHGEVTHITTPKFSFTIPQDAADLDIASMVEDLESFAEEIENEKNEAITENSRKSPCKDKNEISNRSTYDRYGQACKNKHIFPVVKIIPGPNNPSSEEDMNYVQNDSDTIVRPVLKIPPQKPFSDLKETYSPKMLTKDKNNHETEQISTEDATSDNSTSSKTKEENHQINDINIMAEANYSYRQRLLSNKYDFELYKGEVKATKEIFIGDPDTKSPLPYNTKKSTEAFKKIPKRKRCVAGDKLQIGKNKLKKITESQKAKRKVSRLKKIANKTVEISSKSCNAKRGETVSKELNNRQEDQSKEVIDKTEEKNKVNNITNERSSKKVGKYEEKGNISIEGTNNLTDIEKYSLNKAKACENSDKTTTENTAAGNETVDGNVESKNSANIRPDQSKIAPDFKEERHTNEAYIHTKINSSNKSDKNTIGLQEIIEETRKSVDPILSSKTKDAKEDTEKASRHTLLKDKSDEIITQTNVNYHENKSKTNNVAETSDSVYDTALSEEEFNYSPLASIGDSQERDEKTDAGCHAELNAATSAGASPKKSSENTSSCVQKTVNQADITDYERSTELILSQNYNEALDGSKTETSLDDHGYEKDPNSSKSNKDFVNNFTTAVGEWNAGKDPILVHEIIDKTAGDVIKQITSNFESKSVESNDASIPENNSTNGNDVVAKSPTASSRNAEGSYAALEKLSGIVKPKTTEMLQKLSSYCKTDKQNKIDKPSRRKRIPTLGIRLQQSFSMATTAKKQTAVSQAERKRSSTPEVNGKIKKSKLSTDKSSVISDSSNLVEKTREITSISEASRLRNLEGDFTSSSSGRKDDCVENISTSNCENETMDSSLSEASRRRNLDKEGTTSSTISDKEKPTNNDRSTSNKKLSNSSQTKQRIKKFKKFDAPLKKRSAKHLFTRKKTNSSVDESSSLGNSCSKSNDNNKSENPRKFVYPARLSQKAIKQEFFEQDRKFYESSGSSADLAKIWEERLKRPPRPTPKQIQQTTCLATIRKTNEGVEVIPAKKKTRPSYNSEKKIVSSLSVGAVNMNIFSDQNAETFDQFIKSDDKDYKSFNFKFEYGEKAADKSNGYMFDFKQVQSVASEYTQNSQSWTFVRKRSEESNLNNQASSCNSLHLFLTPPNDFSLTPEGFYKQNKEDILSLLKKYK